MVERHMNVIELKGFSASVMEILLNSIYGESVTVTSDNVQDILPAASLLQLNGTGLFYFLFLLYLTFILVFF
jgi:kelch-like protein 12